MKLIKHIISLLLILFLVESCTINSNRMLRTPRNYEFDQIESELSQLEYKIDVNDQLNFQLYTNNGFQLIDMFGENNGSGIQTQRMMMGVDREINPVVWVRYI